VISEPSITVAKPIGSCSNTVALARKGSAPIKACIKEFRDVNMEGVRSSDFFFKNCNCSGHNDKLYSVISMVRVRYSQLLSKTRTTNMQQHGTFKNESSYLRKRGNQRRLNPSVHEFIFTLTNDRFVRITLHRLVMSGLPSGRSVFLSHSSLFSEE
jgi:hypothetical protein